MPQDSSSFPDDFLWGVASSAYQVEGAAATDGRTPSVWDACCDKPGFVSDGQSGDVACDSYNRVEEDADLIGGLGVGAYRFSISWTRVIPGGTGAVNAKGLDYYDRLVDALLARGVAPWVTLFHWDFPQSLFEKGGWANRDAVEWFAEYTDAVVGKLGDRVKHWMTLNEPQCFVGLGHCVGHHAPGLQLPRREVLKILHNSLVAHGRSVERIRAHANDHKIGWAPVGMSGFPDTESPADIEAARTFMFERCAAGDGWIFSNALYADPVILGKYPDRSYGSPDGESGTPIVDELPENHADDLPVISQPLDFYGVNIYQGTRVKAGPDGEPIAMPFIPGHPRTMMDWPVTPEALYWGPRFLAERYKLPVYITENGLASTDWVHKDGAIHDPARIDYVDRHLDHLARAARDGVDVRGYFHWSIMDNFEWAFGYTKRFGLVHVDFDTGVRTPKDSYRWFKDRIASSR